MAERIITADEARALREAATPGPWRDDTFGQVIGQHNVSILRYDEEDGFGCVARQADGRLIVAAPDLAWTVEQLTAERDRLARMLAVERGDASQAPEGWTAHYAGDMWTRTVSGRTVWIHRFAPDGVSLWEMRGVRRDDPRHRAWATALEAMEAIDAEVFRG